MVTSSPMKNKSNPGQVMDGKLKLNLRNSLVAGHQVYGSHLLPGLAYIDMLYQLFRKHGYQHQELELRNLSIFNPLSVNVGGEVVLNIRCTGEGAGRWQIVVDAGEHEGNGANTQPRRYITAEMHHVTPVAFNDVIDVDSLATQASKSIALEEIYAECRKRDLLHTGVMKAEGTLHMSDDAVFVLCSTADTDDKNAFKAMFHPALLDSSALCAGIAWATVGGLSDSRLVVPIHYESFRSTALFPNRCIARVRRDAQRNTNDIGYQTLEFFDWNGKKVAELKNLAGKIVRDPASMNSQRVDQIPAIENPQPKGAVAHTFTGVGREIVGATVPIEEFLREIIAAALHAPESRISPDIGYYELGLQSSDLLGIAQLIQQRIGVTLAPTLLFEYPTIASLATFLGENYGNPSLIPGSKLPNSDASPPLRGPSLEEEKKASPVSAAPVQAGPPLVINMSDDAHSPDPRTEIGPRPVDIAVIGVSGYYPEAKTLDQFWQNIKLGKDCIREIPLERWDFRQYFDSGRGTPGKSYCKWGSFVDDVDAFDAEFFDFVPGEAEIMDPQGRLLMETVWNLLESAGYTREVLQKRYNGNVGLYVGAMYQHYRSLIEDLNSESIAAICSHSAIANRISYFFGFNGPSIAIDTMSSSSMVAIHMACKDLMLGECKVAIASGVNLTIDPKKYIGLSQAQLVASHPNSRSFSDGDGFLPAEGVGAVLLKPLAQAIADGNPVLAVIKATATNHGGRSNGFGIPNLNMQAELIEQNLRKAEIDPRTISYVEAAANGSPLGDMIEVAALGKAFSKFTTDRQFCAIGSVKSIIGHAEAASGISQLTKVILQLQHGQLAPLIKTEKLNPNLNLSATPFHLQTDLREWDRPIIEINGVAQEVPRRAMINSFGGGGSYANIIIEEYIGPQPQLNLDSYIQYLMVFSAKNNERLGEVVREMLHYLREHPEADLRAVERTLQCGRESMEARVAWLVDSREQLLHSMAEYAESGDPVDGREQVHLRGSPDEQSEISSLLTGRAGDILIQTLLSERALDKLALLWVRGAKIPWEVLHDRSAKTIPLPTYPFKRSRFAPPKTVVPIVRTSPIEA